MSAVGAMRVWCIIYANVMLQSNALSTTRHNEKSSQPYLLFAAQSYIVPGNSNNGNVTSRHYHRSMLLFLPSDQQIRYLLRRQLHCGQYNPIRVISLCESELDQCMVSTLSCTLVRFLGGIQCQTRKERISKQDCSENYEPLNGYEEAKGGNQC